MRIVASVLIVCAAVLAQTPPKFEGVASIKPSSPGVKDPSEVRPLPGGRITVTKVPVKVLIQTAFRIQPFQITGGPSWIDSTPYDMEVKPEIPPRRLLGSKPCKPCSRIDFNSSSTATPKSFRSSN